MQNRNFLATSAKKLVIGLQSVLKISSMQGTEVVNQAAKKNADVFPVHAMGASRASIVNADSWYCDSGATRHITPSKHYFVSYTKFANPEKITRKIC